MPGIVAKVFETPKTIPEKGPEISFIFTKWPAPQRTALWKKLNYVPF